MQCLYVAWTTTKHPLKGGVHLQEVFISGGSAICSFSRCASQLSGQKVW